MIYGWPSVPLAQLLRPISRPEAVEPDRIYRLLGAHWYAEGLYIKDTKPGSLIQANRLYRIERGDFVYNRLFGWKGSFAVAREADSGCYVSGEFPCFEVDRQRLDPAYLWRYFARSIVWQEALGLSTGGTPTSRNRLKEDRLLAMTIPLPTLAEQRRIVARIEELTAKIEEARGLRRTASAQSEILPVTALKRVRYAALQSNYERDRLGNVTQVTAGGTPARDNPSYWNGSIPWVKSGELLDGDIYDTEEHISEAGVLNSSAKVFPAETILVALYGQGQTRGRTARLMLPATTNQACCGVLPAATRLEPRYVQYWLRSLYLELREESHGGAQPNWNGQTIKSIVIAMPPLTEQRKTVEELDEFLAGVEAVKRLQAKTAAELDALLPSILDKAFKGEVV
jgi:type I restriction enzyme, S subunit